MADKPEELIAIAVARLALLTNLMRLLLRERAAQHGQTPEEILRWSEEIKVSLEKSSTTAVGAYLSAATDEFFNLLASEVRRDRENR